MERELKTLIERTTKGGKDNIHAIARRAGIHPTVLYAFVSKTRGPKGLRPATLEAIAEALGYQHRWVRRKK